MTKFIKYFFPALILIIVVFLCFKNYTPGTYLIGWDSIHPEFNFPLAFNRIINGAWRSEQGVGAIAAHGDTADLPRVIFLWLSSFVLPTSFLRYFYIFVCLALGPLGIYFFLKYVFQKENNSNWIYPSAFLGSLFYLLNLGTLQNFYVPLEMFPTAFAFLPWLFYTGLKYLRDGKKGSLLFFAILVILSSPMAYAATLAYASFAGLFIFLSLNGHFKRVLILGSLTLFLSLYWILPNIYSLIFQSATIKNANINLLFSPEAFLRNADYGDIKDVLIQKNFLFSWRNFDFTSNQFMDLLGTWIKYLASPFVLASLYILSGLSIFGLVFSIIKKNKVALSLTPVLLLTLFFLFNVNPPVGGIYAYFYNNFGLFSEGFRMPFTKFSVLFEILTSFYFGYFVFIIATLKVRPLKPIIVFLKTLIFISIVGGLIFTMLPAFNGWLIGPNVRKNLPSQYQQVFNWFNNNDYGRIALLPINSKYGWEYRNWGYEGSGFLTYGISDPILYRDFDRWSSANEDFYSQTSSDFVNTIKKYDIKYLLLDESITNAGVKDKPFQIPDDFKQVAKFGFLTVYEAFSNPELYSPQKFIQTDLDLSYSSTDPVYEKYGDYINLTPSEPIRTSPTMPTVAPLISENLSVNRGFKDAFNCDLEKTGSVTKQNSASGILYKAQDGGVACDFLTYPTLKYNQAYVLRIAGENKEGRSLKFYLFDNNSGNPDLEEVLPSGKFDKTFLIYPKTISGSGYTLNLETRSFGRIPSENLLSKVEFYNTPFKGASLQGEYSIENNLKIQDIQKFGNWGYKVSTQGTGLLQLSEGYDGGWIAFEMTNFKFLRHVKVNSWSNGWIVPSSIQYPVSSIFVFYWPQLLEWVGMVFGALALYKTYTAVEDL